MCAFHHAYRMNSGLSAVANDLFRSITQPIIQSTSDSRVPEPFFDATDQVDETRPHVIQQLFASDPSVQRAVAVIGEERFFE